MSADNEHYELIRNGLARRYAHFKSEELLSWGVTGAGRKIAQHIKDDAL